jgi:probable HAF family extracellular repeat protein
MKHWAQNGLKALTSAWVLALLATVAWSQSITWLGTLGGRSERGFWCFRQWLRGGRLGFQNAAGQGRAFRWTASGGMQDLGTLGGCCSVASGVSANGDVVVGVARNAARYYRAFRWTPSERDAGPRHAGRRLERGFGVSADGAVVVGWAYNAAGQQRAFRWTPSERDAGPRHAARRRWERGFWCFRQRARDSRQGFQRRRVGSCLSLDGGWGDARSRHAGRQGELWLLVFPPMAPWWSARLRTPHGRGVPFAGRLLVGCRTSARWAADTIGARLMVFPPMARWWSAGLPNAAGYYRAFRWTASGGIEDLNLDICLCFPAR